MRKNQTNFEADAYLTCKNNTFFKCSQYLFPQNKGISQMKDWIRNDAKNSSERAKVFDEFKRIDNKLRYGLEEEATSLYHELHHNTINMGIQQVNDRIIEL